MGYGKRGSNSGGPPFARAAELYQKSKKPFLRKRSFLCIETDLKHLNPYFGKFTIDEINEIHWARFVLKKRETMPDFRFFNTRKTLVGMLRMSQRMEWQRTLPKLENPDLGKPTAWKIYQLSEIHSLLNEASGDLYLQIVMAYEMGMRRGEILSLAWADIDLKSHCLRVLTEKSKTKKTRLVPVSANVFRLLRHRARLPSGPYLFPSPTGKTHVSHNFTAWRAAKRRSKVRGRFHDLRHTALTRMFERVGNPALVCGVGGLSMETAQARYIHFGPRALRRVPNHLKLKKR